MAVKGKEYELAIRVAGIVDKSFNTTLATTNANLKALKLNLNGFDQAFTKMDKGFDKIMKAGKTCFNALATAAGVATVAIGATVAASTKIGAEFEAEMSTVAAISGSTEAELLDLSNTAREIAKTTVFSATEVGQAMEYMGMAGWKSSEMIAGTKGIIDLAAASGEDLARVSDIVTDTLTAMGMGAEETSHMVDILAQAAMNSNTNVDLMGDTFKYAAPIAGAMGYNMEDLAIATGLMASNGIKGSIAGTSLRNMLTRMVKPTKEAKDAINKLGLSLTNDEGEMYTLLEIMQQLRQNFAESDDLEGMQKALTELAGLTDEQIDEVQSSLGELSAAEEAFYAAELGGQRGMSGLLAIANSTDKQFLELTQAIYEADGAADKMASRRLDNLKGDATILLDTLREGGLELYFQFNDELRNLTQGATDLANTLISKIPGAYKKISAEFPTLKRKFNQYAKPVFDTMLEAGKWTIKHGSGIISVLTGIGGALAAYKIGSEATHIITALKALTKPQLAITGVTAAIGGLIAAYTLYKQHEKKMIDKSLEEHFGNIALSMEEINKIASQMADSGNISEAKKVLEEFSKLDTISASIDETVQELNKYNWMVSIGLKLDEEDQESYKAAIDEYIKNSKEYILQEGYAVTVNLATVLDNDATGKSVSEKVTAFYNNNLAEFEKLGTDLGNAVQEAFTNGFDPSSVETVQKIQQQIADLKAKLALNEYEAKLMGLTTTTAGKLSNESFSNLVEAVTGEASTNKEIWYEKYNKTQATYNALRDLPNGDASRLTGEEYGRISAANKAELTENLAKTDMMAAKSLLEMLSEYYGDSLTKYDEIVKEVLAEYSTEEYAGYWQNREGEMWETVANEVSRRNKKENKYNQKAVKEKLNEMSDLLEQLDYLQGIYDSLDDETKEAVGEVTGLLNRLKGFTSSKTTAFNTNETNSALISHISSASGANTIHGYIDNNATGGIIHNKELSWLAENGPEAVIPLDGSRRAFSLWEQVGQLLHMGSFEDRYDLSTASAGSTITYSPTLQFYGEAPSKEDLNDALRMSQDEFNTMMDRYIKLNGRVAF